ncbi:MAG TPA: phosphopantetheine-binding protein, partial [Blastocatellia bacterium]|nr:phosphopantetheine-binding protein [Blastocatellia bacterium]
VKDLCRAGESEVLTVEASDRFGGYGLVGVVIFRARAGALAAETFLLSCRALGRGVEHQVLARLGEIARARGVPRVEVAYRESQKNRPALDFLESVGAGREPAAEGEFLFSLPAELAAAVRFDPSLPAAPEEAGAGVAPPASREVAARADSALLTRIAAELSSADQVLGAVEARRRRSRPDVAASYVAPGTPTESELARVWAQILGVDRVGADDDFFGLGGNSLLATVLMSRVHSLFEIDLAPHALFEAPTVAGLAELIEREQIERAGAAEVADILGELDELSDEEVKALLAAGRQQ